MRSESICSKMVPIPIPVAVVCIVFDEMRTKPLLTTFVSTLFLVLRVSVTKIEPRLTTPLLLPLFFAASLPQSCS